MTKLLKDLKKYIQDLYNYREELQKKMNGFTEVDWGESSEPDKVNVQITLINKILTDLDLIIGYGNLGDDE